MLKFNAYTYDTSSLESLYNPYDLNQNNMKSKRGGNYASIK